MQVVKNKRLVPTLKKNVLEYAEYNEDFSPKYQTICETYATHNGICKDCIFFLGIGKHPFHCKAWEQKFQWMKDKKLQIDMCFKVFDRLMFCKKDFDFQYPVCEEGLIKPCQNTKCEKYNTIGNYVICGKSKEPIAVMHNVCDMCFSLHLCRDCMNDTKECTALDNLAKKDDGIDIIPNTEQDVLPKNQIKYYSKKKKKNDVSAMKVN